MTTLSLGLQRGERLLDEPKPTVGNDAEESKTRVFLSYSRKDAFFTRQLAKALAERGYATDYDQSDLDPGNIESGISAEDEWWQRLQAMIAAADVMVFIVSPDSAASKVCDEEIAYARNVGKRIVPILCRPIDFAKAPPRLSALNVKINFTDDREDAFGTALVQLCTALDLDVAWHRENRRLTELALRWERERRTPDRLMSPADIRATERLLESRPRNADPPPQVLTDFLDASRARIEEEVRQLRRITGRAFVKPARQALDENSCDTALRLTAAGVLLSEDFNMSLVPEHATTALWQRAAFECRLLRVLAGRSTFSRNGATIATTSSSTSATVWDLASGAKISTLHSFGNNVHIVAVNPVGTRILTRSEWSNGTSKGTQMWDATTGQEIGDFREPGERLWTATLSPDGSRVAATSISSGLISISDGVRILDTATGAELGVLRENAQRIKELAFSPDGTRILVASDDPIVHVWDVASGDELVPLRGHEESVWSAEFSLDGARITTASWDKTARVWNAATGTEIAVLRGHQDHVSQAKFSPDGTRVVTVSGDQTARVWDAATGSEISTLRGHEGDVNTAFFSPDGTRIVTASDDRTARVWDAATGAQLVALRGHEGEVAAAAFSPDGTRIITDSRDGTTRVWDAALGPEVVVLLGHEDKVGRATFSPDGMRIATASEDTTARLWNAVTGGQITVLHGHDGRIWKVAFTLGGDRLLTASEDKTVRVWDVTTGLETALLRGHQGSVNNAAFSPDGSKIVTASSWDGTARVWDAATGAELVVLRDFAERSAPAFRLSFSSDGMRIIIVFHDSTTRIWDAITGAEIVEKSLRGDGQLSAVLGRPGRGGPSHQIRMIAISPKGDRVVTNVDDHSGRAQVWDVATGEEITVLRGHRRIVWAAAFSPDSTRIVTASGDGTARIWDATTGSEMAILRGHKGDVGCAEFSSDGERIVTASDDRTARVWDVSRTTALTGNPAEALAASLTNGRGLKTRSEHADLLMQAAPDDLYEAIAAQLTPQQLDNVARRGEILGRRLHPNCYLSRAELAKKFRTNLQPASASSSLLDDEETSQQGSIDATSPEVRPVSPSPADHLQAIQALPESPSQPHRSRWRLMLGIVILLLAALCTTLVLVGGFHLRIGAMFTLSERPSDSGVDTLMRIPPPILCKVSQDGRLRPQADRNVARHSDRRAKAPDRATFGRRA